MIVSAIILIAVGYFILEYVPGIVNAKGGLASIIKLVGIVFLILGVVRLIQALLLTLHLSF